MHAHRDNQEIVEALLIYFSQNPQYSVVNTDLIDAIFTIVAYCLSWPSYHPWPFKRYLQALFALLLAFPHQS